MQSAWCRACSEIWWSTSMSFIAEAMYWFHFLAGKQCGHILLNLDGKPDLTTLDVWEDSSTKLPFLARSAEVYFQSEMLQRLHKREREREKKNFWCFQGQPFLCLCKEALPLRNGHGRCQRSPKLFAQHIWSLETLDEDIASG